MRLTFRNVKAALGSLFPNPSICSKKNFCNCFNIIYYCFNFLKLILRLRKYRHDKIPISANLAKYSKIRQNFAVIIAIAKVLQNTAK